MPELSAEGEIASTELEKARSGVADKIVVSALTPVHYPATLKERHAHSLLVQHSGQFVLDDLMVVR